MRSDMSGDMFSVITTHENYIDGSSALTGSGPHGRLGNVKREPYSSLVNPSVEPEMFETMKFSQRNSKYFYRPNSGDMVFSPLNSAKQTESKYLVNTSGRAMNGVRENGTITSYLSPDNAFTGGNRNKLRTISSSAFDKSNESEDSLSESNYSQHSDTSNSTTGAKSFNSSSTDLGNYLLDKQRGVRPSHREGNGAIDRDESFTKTVAMLMKVVIHLRQNYPTKHVYRMREVKWDNPGSSDDNSSSVDARGNKSPRVQKRISFTPKTLLFSAVAEKSYIEVKAILETEDIDVNSKSPSGQSLLHIAAANADLRVAQLLLQFGATVKTKDSNGWSPLHSAVRRGNWKCAILLVEAGADIAEYAQGRIQEYNDMLRMSRTCYKSVEIFV